MSEVSPRPDDPLSVQAHRRVDAACLRFEALWMAGGPRPALADFLAAVTGAERRLLLDVFDRVVGERACRLVAELVHETAGIAEDGSDDPRARIASLVRGEERADRIVNGVAHAIGLPGAQAAPDETFWSIRRLLEAIARRGALVVLFEDVHWAEPTLLDLIEHVAGWTRDAPMLLLCLARPELLNERPAWPGEHMALEDIIGDVNAHEQPCVKNYRG